MLLRSILVSGRVKYIQILHKILLIKYNQLQQKILIKYMYILQKSIN